MTLENKNKMTKKHMSPTTWWAAEKNGIEYRNRDQLNSLTTWWAAKNTDE